MSLLYQDLVGIVERSGTLHERLLWGRISSLPAAEDLNSLNKEGWKSCPTNHTIDLWCKTAAHGDWQRFKVRLACDGLDLDAVRQCLGPVRLKDGEPLPPWADALDKVVRLMETEEGALFEPFIRFARRSLKNRCGEAWPLLSQKAARSLERHLLARLSNTAQAVLDLKFDVYRSLREPLFFDAERKPAPDDPLYREFSKHMLQGGWPGVLTEYPVLARLLATLVDFWVQSVGVFFDHLEHDRQLLQDTFCPGVRLGSIADIRAGLSDPHLCGKTVMEIAFDSGVKLLYKPKDLEMDAAWFKLLQWLNGRGITHPFRLLKVVPRSGYGWMEHVESLPCRDKKDAGDYYHQAGRLLCLIYILEGTDFQHENIVASADQPVLVDFETLMQPQVRMSWAGLSPTRFPETVLRTHFLPQWERDGEGKAFWLGGLDRAHTLDGAGLALADYTDPLCEGFLDMYSLLIRCRDEITSPDGPLAAFAGCKSRPIFNATSFYVKIRTKSLQPKVLRDGAERSILLEHLYRLPVADGVLRELSPRCRQEIEAIERLDIPRFEARTDTVTLYTESSEPIGDLFVEAPLDRVRTNFLHLNIHDLNRQVELIRAAIAFKEAARSETHVGQAGKPAPHDSWTSDCLLDAAADIAEGISRKAVHTRSGAAAWMIPVADKTGKTLYRFSHSDSFLYDGAAGIALFLSAMESVRKGKGYGELAQDALRPIHAFLDAPYLQRRTTIGATEGLGSIVYALVKIAAFLNDSGLIEAAERMAAMITLEKIAADTRYDLLAGSAGAVLGLLALHEITCDPTILSRAVQCGEHLLACRTPVEAGQGLAGKPAPHRVWRTIQGKPVSGLSHGLAGMAYALLRLFGVTGQESFFEAANEAISFERTLFSPAHGNWLAFGSTPEEPIIWTTFCHGAPGIGLARVGGLPWMDTDQVRQEIDVSLETTLSHPPEKIDFLCCGNFGRIDVLATAAKRLDRPDLLEAARKKAGSLLRDRHEMGFFKLYPDLPGFIDNPGFFKGTAGIGYVLLRLALKEPLPDVLLWE